MLSGASSLSSVRVGVELLPCLPVSRREALENLHLDAYLGSARAVRDILQAVKDCTHLTSLTITCLKEGWVIPELNLRPLLLLSTCRLQCLRAPRSLLLSRGRTELTIAPDQIRAWSKLWPKIQHHVRYISIEGYRHLTRSAFYSAGPLHAWPEGIDAFHGLQFLQIDCGPVWPSGGVQVLELGHLAYIPHVSLRCQGSVELNIATGSWKVLEIQTLIWFAVAIADVETFVKGVGVFSFTFPSNKEPSELLRELREASAVLEMPLYEYHSNFTPMREYESYEYLTELSNHEQGPQDTYQSPYLEALHRSI